eukprot:COSAG01_NODE_2540_length_7478_cov_13.257759_7_plen_92_part_00
MSWLRAWAWATTAAASCLDRWQWELGLSLSVGTAEAGMAGTDTGWVVVHRVQARSACARRWCIDPSRCPAVTASAETAWWHTLRTRSVMGS